MPKAKRSKPFTYSKAEGHSPDFPVFNVRDAKARKAIGQIRKDNPRMIAVSRPQDDEFHRSFGCPREAALWLRDHQDDPAVYEDEDS